MRDAASCYRILGLAPDATPEQVKRAFRGLARRWHPDKAAQDPEQHRMAQEKMKEINAAYEFLRPRSRAPRFSHPNAPDIKQRAEEERSRQSHVDEEAEALEQQIRAIERLYLETMEQQRRIRNGLCCECGQPLTRIQKILGSRSHGKCGQRKS